MSLGTLLAAARKRAEAGRRDELAPRAVDAIGEELDTLQAKPAGELSWDDLARRDGLYREHAAALRRREAEEEGL
jgi:hypothetical protein